MLHVNAFTAVNAQGHALAGQQPAQIALQSDVEAEDEYALDVGIVPDQRQESEKPGIVEHYKAFTFPRPRHLLEVQ